MFKHQKLISLTLLALLCTSISCERWQEGTASHEDLNMEHKCHHDIREKEEPQLMAVDEDLSFATEGRLLASYPSLKTTGYYGRLSSTTSSYRSYLENDLIPPILDYFGAALKNKYPLSGNLKWSQSSVCGGSTPSNLKSGINTDFFFIVEAESDGGNWVADSTACYLAEGSKRPLIARTTVNRNMMKATNDIILHEKNMICIMHEVIHTLGFSSMLFKHFVGSNGKKLSSVVQSGSAAGSTHQVIVADPIVSKVRNHFGCGNIKGAFLENSGGDATAGSHFERRQFGPEAMTSGLIYEMAVSELTLAMLESSGWYAVDYDYADAYNWGKGQGCDFLTKSCTSSGTGLNFDEFCGSSSARRGCTFNGVSGGACNVDSRSEKCGFYKGESNWHCENPDAEAYARLPGIQTFGRGGNSRCFEGTLSSNSQSSATTFCFKFDCSGSGSNTKLEIKVGGKSVTCTHAGDMNVSGYNGHVKCPDPLTFCSTVGKKTCPRGCMGRGNCNGGVCSCYSGYKGKDCGLNS